jgi:hypothetical protein
MIDEDKIAMLEAIKTLIKIQEIVPECLNSINKLTESSNEEFINIIC